MQVEVDVHGVWWAWPLILEILVLFFVLLVSLFDHRHSPPESKKRIDFKKVMQMEVYAICMYTKFGGRGFSDFGDFAAFVFLRSSLFNHEL